MTNQILTIFSSGLKLQPIDIIAPIRPQSEAGVKVRATAIAKGPTIIRLRCYWARSLMIRYARRRMLLTIKAIKI